jgi:DNA polymerase-3 subunit epsilon
MSFFWPFSKPLNPVAEAYYSGRKLARPARHIPVESLRFVVIDAETSGFDPEKDRILSLAAVEIVGGQMNLASFRSWIVYQSCPTLNPAISIHGITPAQTASGEPEEKVLDEFLQFTRGAILVGHHISFDAAMIDQAMQRYFKVGLYNSMVDTAMLAMRELEAFRKTGYANQRPPALEEVCSHCGVPMLERHTAEGDVFTTGELFMLLCARRRKRINRPLEWRDLPWTRP